MIIIIGLLILFVAAFAAVVGVTHRVPRARRPTRTEPIANPEPAAAKATDAFER